MTAAGQQTLPTLAVLAAFSFAVTATGVHLLTGYLRARRVLDVPNERSSHSVPVPRGGGTVTVAVLLVVVTSVAIAHGGAWPFLALAGACAVIAGVSLVDDLRAVPSSIRLGIHLCAALIALVAFGPIKTIALDHWTLVLPGAIAVVLSVLWIAGLTNAYNFMDGIDLMASGQGVVAGLGWALIGSIIGSPAITIIGAAVASSVAGFATHNWPPARIFMGDVGSATLGFTFGALVLAASRIDPVAATAGLLLVWPFVFDTAFTFVRRLRRRERVFQAHRSHLYQRLTIAGVSHLRVSLLYFFLEAIGAAAAVALTLRAPSALAALGAIPVAALALWIIVVTVERRASSSQLTGSA